ncbi:probable gluconokinase isoform X1 [Trachemys scripta elegans]|uniref:probable gluconokinase isoform X4 n=2 Tax=Chrysemys picta bellii TaxID=8478 RepID=UPI0015522F5A|nr:probable gluconokinase isoform X1 [Trachemys scripta elegans]XP_053888732.1 probable gluconokinase isoform X1 [Malaclemys terrapin pileata]
MVLLVVMGVSGSGKSTVGSHLAAKLGWKFYDADDYHPTENTKKMAQGIPLNDQDRIPWLCKLHDILMREESAGQSVILACSALKKMYRRILVSGGDAVYSKSDQLDSATGKVLFIHLDGSMELIASRLEKRRGHFMAPELLQSQFDTLEPPSAPENFITVSLEKSVSEIVSEIEKSLHLEKCFSRVVSELDAH